MGNCVKGDRDKEKLRKPKLNEHSHVQRKFNMGISLEKDPTGEINLGLRTAFIVKKDKDFSAIDKNEIYEDLEKKEPVYTEVVKSENPR